jgi:hypothetical protein
MSDQPADDPNDLLLQRQIADEARTAPVGVTMADQDALLAQEQADPVNRNLAMQLAIQHNPGADMDTLKASADEFYGYLTQHS